VRGFRVLVGVLCGSYVAFRIIDFDDDDDDDDNHIKNYKETTMYYFKFLSSEVGGSMLQE